MIFDRATKVATKLLGGWADAYRVAKCSANNGRSVLVNSQGQVLDFWEGLGWWWVETNKLSVERDTAKSLEDLFGNSEPSAHVDSDSMTFKSGPNQVASIPISGGVGLGTIAPSTPFVVDNITGSKYGIDEWVDSLYHSTMRITTTNAVGSWDWEKIIVETSLPPNPIRRILISLLTGAKWTPYSSKHEMKYYGYLRLMPNPAYLTHKNPSTY